MYSSTTSMTRVGCLVAALGVATLAVAMFGLRHALIEFGNTLPVLPGLLAGLTHFARALIRMAVANVSVLNAAVLIALGLFLLYQSGFESR